MYLSRLGCEVTLPSHELQEILKVVATTKILCVTILQFKLSVRMVKMCLKIFAVCCVLAALFAPGSTDQAAGYGSSDCSTVPNTNIRVIY